MTQTLPALPRARRPRTALLPRVTARGVRFTVIEYWKMLEADVFGTRRVELIDGRVYRMAQNLPHRTAISNGIDAISTLKLATDWLVVGGTLRLDLLGIDDESAPDPDLMWFDKPKGTPDVALGLPMLLIEVSDTTYRKDSGVKLRLYARAGVADYWIENLNAGRVEVHRDPVNDTGRPDGWRYASITHHARGQSIPLLKRPGASLAVGDLLP